MSIPFIDLKTQYQELKPQIQERINRVLEHGQYIMGPEVEELETKLAEYTGARYCITVASGTEALLISLMALGIGPGDEVITTPFTFVATAEVIVLLGAKPVFVDIEPDTCNINAALIEEKINHKTKAIIPVSLYGQPADMDEINKVASRHGNIPVIEDAAQSFGAVYKGRKSCALSTIGCTSFFPSKPLGCYGDGGAIFTSEESLANKMRQIRVHGQSKRYIHDCVGLGGRMDTIQCAVVLVKLLSFEAEIASRRDIATYYNEAFDRKGIKRTVQKAHNRSVFGQYTIFCRDREQFAIEMKKAGIPTAVHYPVPLNQQEAYRGFCCVDCTPEANRVAGTVCSIPFSPYLTDPQISEIVLSTCNAYFSA